MKEQRLEELFALYINRQCNEQEEIELMQLLSEPTLSAKTDQLLESAYDQLPESFFMSNEQADSIFNQIIQQPANVRRINIVYRKVAAAAAILILIATGGYFLFVEKPVKNTEIANAKSASQLEAPKVAKAVITLADGTTVLLDSVANGTLALQGNVSVVKNEQGEIHYKGKESEVVYNTLFNPRGSKVVTLVLSDGTKVWLNSESTLKYPIAFTEKERKIEISGEAYFEVAKDPNRKFLVEANGATTEVLGTHFNVNSYDDEESIKITLLEGSVKVSKAGTNAMLQPGQQASVTNTIEVTNGADIDQVMAWKNGYFLFNEADIKTVMNQLSRWYDVEVVYEKGVPDINLGGEMKRDLNLSQVLKGLGKIGVNFRIEGKKLIVLP